MILQVIKTVINELKFMAIVNFVLDVKRIGEGMTEGVAFFRKNKTFVYFELSFYPEINFFVVKFSFTFFMSVRDRFQICLLILSKFKRCT